MRELEGAGGRWRSGRVVVGRPSKGPGSAGSAGQHEVGRDGGEGCWVDRSKEGMDGAGVGAWCRRCCCCSLRPLPALLHAVPPGPRAPAREQLARPPPSSSSDRRPFLACRPSRPSDVRGSTAEPSGVLPVCCLQCAAWPWRGRGPKVRTFLKMDGRDEGSGDRQAELGIRGRAQRSGGGRRAGGRAAARRRGDDYSGGASQSQTRSGCLGTFFGFSNRPLTTRLSRALLSSFPKTTRG